MPEDVMLHEAIEAIRKRQPARARDILTRLLRSDPNNPTYWIWMSSVVDARNEQAYCLETAQKLDPENQTSSRGLRLIGIGSTYEDVQPLPPVRRYWSVAERDIQEMSTFRRLWANPILSLTVLSLTALLVIVLFGIGVAFQGRRRVPVMAVIPTRTLGPTPTYTLTPTAVNEIPKASTARPVITGLVPLWALLEETYTPTPIYVNTPHAANESYNLGQRAFERGDLKAALSNLSQAELMDPEAADIPYLMGEIFRLQGEWKAAAKAYEKSLQIMPGFAPALLGLARASRYINLNEDVGELIIEAVEADPEYGEAFLDLVAYQLEVADIEAALETLQKIEGRLDGSPVYYLRRAQAELAQGKFIAAYEDARQANQLDQTLLESYQVLAISSAANEDYKTAIEAARVYLKYRSDDPDVWFVLGKSLYQQGNYSSAKTALEKALEVDDGLFEAFLFRGLVMIELEEGQKAVNDIYRAYQKDTRSFFLNLSLGRALLAAGRLGDALAQMNRTYDMADGEAEVGEALFWRAQVYQAIGNPISAIKDWNSMLELPGGSVPNIWLETAQASIQLASTKTATNAKTVVATRTPKLTPTQTPTKHPAPSYTPKLQNSSLPFPRLSPSLGQHTPNLTEH